MIDQIIPGVLMILSLAIILFLVGRKIPNSIKNLDKEVPEKNKNKENLDPKNIKEKATNVLEKTLRKLKVVILRGDAKIMQLIKRIQDKKKNRSPLTIDIDESEEEDKKLKKNILGKIKKLSKKEEANQKQEKNDTETETEDDDKKQPILERMSKIREKLTSSNPKEIKKTAPKVTKKKPQAKTKKEKTAEKGKKKSKATSFPKKQIDLEEAKRVMFERDEEKIIKRISANPKDDNAYVELGKLYLKAENVEDSKASFKQAIKINRGNVTAKKYLKEIADKLG